MTHDTVGKLVYEWHDNGTTAFQQVLWSAKPLEANVKMLEDRGRYIRDLQRQVEVCTSPYVAELQAEVYRLTSQVISAGEKEPPKHPAVRRVTAVGKIRYKTPDVEVKSPLLAEGRGSQVSPITDLPPRTPMMFAPHKKEKRRPPSAR